MKLRSIVWTAVAAAALSGCVVAVRDGGPPRHAPAHGYREAHGHAYIYYPGYYAYHCTVHDDWWCLDGGNWAYFTVRPSHIHWDVNVSWVHVDIDGPEPFVHYEVHQRDYPRDWRPARDMGPPPGHRDPPGGRGQGDRDDGGDGEKSRGGRDKDRAEEQDEEKRSPGDRAREREEREKAKERVREQEKEGGPEKGRDPRKGKGDDEDDSRGDGKRGGKGKDDPDRGAGEKVKEKVKGKDKDGEKEKDSESEEEKGKGKGKKD